MRAMRSRSTSSSTCVPIRSRSSQIPILLSASIARRWSPDVVTASSCSRSPARSSPPAISCLIRTDPPVAAARAAALPRPHGPTAVRRSRVRTDRGARDPRAPARVAERVPHDGARRHLLSPAPPARYRHPRSPGAVADAPGAGDPDGGTALARALRVDPARADRPRRRRHRRADHRDRARDARCRLLRRAHARRPGGHGGSARATPAVRRRLRRARAALPGARDRRAAHHGRVLHDGGAPARIDRRRHRSAGRHRGRRFDPVTPRSRFIVANRLRHHVLEWREKGPQRPWPLGKRLPSDRPSLLLLHGFLEHAHTWDLVAPHLAAAGWHVVALDWRGHGASDWIGDGGYYHFVDYSADLAFLVRALGGRAVVVGHSMGATAAMNYAGLEPERVPALILVDGLGPPDLESQPAPVRYHAWIADLERAEHRVRRAFTIEQASARLRDRFPRFSPTVARHMAEHGSRAADGGRVWKFDPLHQTTSPVPFSRAR